MTWDILTHFHWILAIWHITILWINHQLLCNLNIVIQFVLFPAKSAIYSSLDPGNSPCLICVSTDLQTLEISIPIHSPTFTWSLHDSISHRKSVWTETWVCMYVRLSAWWPSVQTKHLCHIYLLMRTHTPTYLTHTNTVSVSAFLYSKGDSSLITLLLSFSIKLSIAGRQCSRRNRDRDKPLSFYLSIDCVSDGCRACPDPQPRLTVSAHYFTVYLSNSLSSDAWSAACLCFPH